MEDDYFHDAREELSNGLDVNRRRTGEQKLNVGAELFGKASAVCCTTARLITASELCM